MTRAEIIFIFSFNPQLPTLSPLLPDRDINFLFTNRLLMKIFGNNNPTPELAQLFGIELPVKRKWRRQLQRREVCCSSAKLASVLKLRGISNEMVRYRDGGLPAMRLSKKSRKPLGYERMCRQIEQQTMELRAGSEELHSQLDNEFAAIVG